MIITDVDKLRENCGLVDPKDTREIIRELEKELEAANKYSLTGIGLAAPQIGINKRVAIIRIDNIKFDLVNCSIEKKVDPTAFREGCLSIPGKSVFVERYNEVMINDNLLGNINKFVAFGLVSVCIQHEMDHWDGILMVDKAISEHTNVSLDNLPCPCKSGLKYKKCCKRKK